MRHSHSAAIVSSSQNIPLTLEEQWTTFLRVEVASGNASDDTLKTYIAHIKQFFKWCRHNRLDPLHLNRLQIKNYRHYLVERMNYKPATIALKLTTVRRFYDCAISYGLISFNPALGIKPPVEKRDPAERINYLERAEVAQLLASLPTDDSVASLRERTLIGIMVLQGCRTVEMHRLKMHDIIRQGNNVGLRVSGKRSIRVVPLTPDLALLLDKYLAARTAAGDRLNDNTPIFISLSNANYGEPLSRRSIQRIVQKHLQAFKQTGTNARKLTTHSLRHTAGTLALRTGAELRQVQDMLGHADPRTTALYAHIADRWERNPALAFGVRIQV
ncbi:integrase family protein (plasmid) [Gloeothece citriformis PCC 7424]|uniref:Integrase family protein n=1 Tax=Gloeothece citriformis (strain PCC 7424) TaxID=65393 RepID=B7KMT6_GLOC7|nr:tyrosine-type recombinase/integrase [Gloeothece citriformis]ACK74108.1 integrase family protein [Gloeothece citriformis PCC 7424]